MPIISYDKQFPSGPATHPIDKNVFYLFGREGGKNSPQSVQRSFEMKVLVAILLVSCLFVGGGSASKATRQQDPFNYLLAAYNYALAIKENFEYATEYYRDYLTQEVQAISDRLINRLALATESIANEELGQALTTCTRSAAIAIQSQLISVHREFEVLHAEEVTLHQVVNSNMRDVNILITELDGLYYEFSDHLFEIYLRMNDELIPALSTEIIALIEIGEQAYQTLDQCLNQIK